MMTTTPLLTDGRPPASQLVVRRRARDVAKLLLKVPLPRVPREVLRPERLVEVILLFRIRRDGDARRL
eukprot:31379-Pelagococcus_subviridis.AAC.18